MKTLKSRYIGQLKEAQPRRPVANHFLTLNVLIYQDACAQWVTSLGNVSVVSPILCLQAQDYRYTGNTLGQYYYYEIKIAYR